MEVILLYPKFKLGKDKWKVGGRSNTMSPPLDMGWISNLLDKENISSKIIDANINRYSNDEIVTLLKKYNPKIILTTSSTYPGYRDITLRKECLETYKNTVQLVKKTLPMSYIVLMGPHSTSFPKKILKETPDLDAVIIGETEISSVDLIKTKLKGDDLSKVKGIAYKNKNEIQVTEKREFFTNLDLFSIPPYEKLNLNKYLKFREKTNKSRHTIMVSSRGCTFNCIYCFKPMIGSKFRTRSVPNIMSEIKILYEKYNVHHISFVDEIFTLMPKRVEEICSQLLKENYQITWDCETRIECVSKELIKKMAKAGCIRILFGIESLIPEIQKNAGKQISFNKIKEVMTICKKEGIYPTPAFQLGLPGDSWKAINKNLKLMNKLGVSITLPLITHIFPKTKLHEIAMETGMIKGDSFEELVNASGLVKTEFKNRAEFDRALKYYHKKIKLMNLRRGVNYSLFFRTIKEKGINYTFRQLKRYFKDIIS